MRSRDSDRSLARRRPHPGSVGAFFVLILLQTAFVLELRKSLRDDLRFWSYHEATRWSFRSPSVVRLRGFLEAIGKEIPPGTPVVFRSVPSADRPDEDLARFRWAVVTAPELDLVHPDDPRASAVPFLVSYGGPPGEDASLRPLKVLADGGLYRCRE